MRGTALIGVENGSRCSVKAILEKVRGGRDATVVIVHDDGDLATCRYLLSEYEKNDLCGTVAMVASRVIRLPSDELDPGAIAAWQALLDTGRFSISCHSRTHAFWGLTDEDEEGTLMSNRGEEIPYRCEAGRITREVRDAGELLRAAFPSERVRAFVKPGFGRHSSGVQISEKAYEIVRKYYVAMRNTGGGVDTLPVRDPYNVRSYMVREGEVAEDWIPYTEQAIAEHGMIVYLMHKIEETASGITVAKCEASRLFAHIGQRKREGRIWVTSFDEAALYSEELRAASLSLAGDGDAIKLSLTVGLDPKIYDTPLTARLSGAAGYLPEDGRQVTKTEDGILLDLLPGETVRLIRKG